ncbi:uncharacterized protein V1516DRAFT_679311 [Lipomyces oligophaga]|uniref:uncharacterized protein n=1 Tax=Lipomyces oligophaga TaxID=45792 RepID=UPI0034CEE83C
MISRNSSKHLLSQSFPKHSTPISAASARNFADKENVIQVAHSPHRSSPSRPVTNQSSRECTPPGVLLSEPRSPQLVSSVIKRQATLSAVTEFATDPIVAVSSSPLPGDDRYAGADFFGSEEREILQLEPGQGHLENDSYLNSSPMQSSSSLSSAISMSDHRENLETTTFAVPTEIRSITSTGTLPVNASSNTNQFPEPAHEEASVDDSQESSFYSAHDDSKLSDPSLGISQTEEPRTQDISVSPIRAIMSPLQMLPLAQSTPFNAGLAVMSGTFSPPHHRHAHSPSTYSPLCAAPLSAKQSSLEQNRQTNHSCSTHQELMTNEVSLVQQIVDSPPTEESRSKISTAKLSMNTLQSKNSLDGIIENFEVQKNLPAESSNSKPEERKLETSIAKIEGNEEPTILLDSNSEARSSGSSLPATTPHNASGAYMTTQKFNDNLEEDDEEEWIPLPKCTPAPASRFSNQTVLYKDLQSSKTAPAREPEPLLEEEDESADSEKEDEVVNESIGALKPGSDVKDTVGTHAAGKQGIERKADAPGYLSSTAASRSRSPIKTAVAKPKAINTGLASPSKSPIKPILQQVGASPARLRPAGGSPSKQPAVTFSTRPIQPSFNKSPLRQAVFPPQSPTRPTQVPDKLKSSGPRTASPERSTASLIRTGSQFTSGQASTIAAMTAASVQANAHSPVSHALRSVKSSTADVFRRARELFAGNLNSDSATKSRNPTKETKLNGAELGSGSVKRAIAEAEPGRPGANKSQPSKSLYPDISALLGDNTGSPGRNGTSVLDMNGHVSQVGPGPLNGNPAKVLFPVPLTMRSLNGSALPAETAVDADFRVSRPNKRSSTDEMPNSGDLHLTPEQQQPQQQPAQQPASATAQSVVSTQGPRVKRIKSTLASRKAPTRQAPRTGLRVPAIRGTEFEHPRKFALTTVATGGAGANSTPVQMNEGSNTSDSSGEPRISDEETKKNEAKREIERRRLENVRRAAAQHEDKRKAGEEEGNVKSKVVPIHKTRMEEAKNIKRNFQIETADGQKIKASLARTSLADHAKRRRTEEISENETKNHRKEVTGATTTTSSITTNIVTNGKPGNGVLGRAVPFVEAVKFSNEKIRFGPASHTQQENTLYSGPRRNTNSGGNSAVATVNATKPAPASSTTTGGVAGNGDNIVLPDICSESEDDEDGSVLLDWANSPALSEQLRNQQKIDPDTIFGPVAPLSMEDVFKTRPGTGPIRFRPRSSSANWSNNDRLTPQEIESYASEMGYAKDQ